MHHSLGPSKYSVWAKCPWANMSASDTKESAEGTDVHEQLQLDVDGIENAEDYRARWAADWVRAESGGAAVYTETRVEGDINSSGTIFGTVDLMWKTDGVLHIADFKTFAVDGDEYLPQLRGYAALWASECGAPGDTKVVLHVLCGGSLTVTTVEDTVGVCIALTCRILDKHLRATEDDARANSKCRYCTKCGECKACIEAAGSLISSSPRNLFGSMPLANKLAFCSMVEKVIEGIKKAAKDEAVRNGGVLEADGVRYELKPSSTYKVKDMGFIIDDMSFNKQFTGKKRGKEYTVDVVIPNALEFVSRCSISRTTLADLVASKNPGMTKKDVTEWVTQFYEKVDGEPKLVRVS